MYYAERLNHTTWGCKYYLIWIPRYRRKLFYRSIRNYLREVFRDRALQKENRVLEGHRILDHVHMLLSIPPNYSVA